MLKGALMSNKISIETGYFSGLIRTEEWLERLTKEMVCEEMKTLDDSLKIFYCEWEQRNMEQQGAYVGSRTDFLM